MAVKVELNVKLMSHEHFSSLSKQVLRQKFYLGLQQIQLEIPDWGCKYPLSHFQGGASAPLAHAWRRP